MSIHNADRGTHRNHRPHSNRQSKGANRHQPVPHSRLTTASFAARFFEALDTPKSLACYILLREGEFAQLVSMSTNPLDYLDTQAERFFRDSQSVKLLSKFPNLPTGIDTKAEALKTFIACEKQCSLTNSSFRHGTYDRLNGRVDSILLVAARKISSILGDVPSLESLDFSFGPGATFGVRGDTSAYKKITTVLECTPALSHTVLEFLEEFPGWIPDGIHDIRLTNGSELIVVPKNAKTDRPIAIPTLLGGLGQKGIGSYMRKRLKRFGVDLDDQTINQRLAQSALARGNATVDFTSCSDLIAYLPVFELLPIDWAMFLDRFREPQFCYEQRWYNFQKFSAMGNAYTFELETLILYGLAYACLIETGIQPVTGYNLSVYGDDVIIAKEAFDLFSQVTAVCGFTVNLKKSFSEGVFFESCGHDYFNGKFVRPFYLNKEPKSLDVAFYYANTVSRFAARYSQTQQAHESIVRSLAALYNWVVGCVSPKDRLYGPEGYGDGHLITPKTVGRKAGTWDGWWFTTIVEKPIRIPLGEVPIGYALYSCKGTRTDTFVLDSIREPLNWGSGYSVRSRTVKRKTTVFCPSVWPTYAGGLVPNEHRGIASPD